MPSHHPSLGFLLATLRRYLGLSQGAVQKATGIPQPAQSAYETGKNSPSPSTVRRWLRGVGWRPRVLRSTSSWSRELTAAAGTEGDVASLRRELLALEAGQRMELCTEALALWLTESAGPGPEDRLDSRHEPRPEDFPASEELWRDLLQCPEEHWPHLFVWSTALHQWAICVRLCEASFRAVEGHHLDRALSLAQRAVELSAKVPGELAWRQRLVAFCGFHAAHALRAQGLLASAQKEAERAWKVWEAGEEADPEGLLDRGQVEGILAALRAETGKNSASDTTA